MFDKFWESIETELANQWKLHAFTPAFFFWAGGLILWISQRGLSSIQALITFKNLGEGIVWMGGLLVLVIFSNELINWMTYPFLRTLEGYWPNWGLIAKLKTSLTGLLTKPVPGKVDKLGDLKEKMEKEPLTPDEKLICIQLESDLSFFPRNKAFWLPTRFGNILRASEEYPYNLYGLEVTTTWSRLWVLLPAAMQEEMATSRRLVDDRARYILWSILFIAWFWITPWALLLPVIALPLVYYLGLLDAAKTYGQMLRVSYDLYRFDLYKALHIVPPTSFEGEGDLGLALTRLFKTGLSDGPLQMDNPQAAPKKEK